MLRLSVLPGSGDRPAPARRRTGADGHPPGRHRAPAARPGRILAGVLACGVLSCAVGIAGLATASRLGHPAIRPGPVPRIAVPAGRLAAVPGPGRPHPVALPRSLVIPAIGVRTRLIRLGLTASGALQVPGSTTVAGWYAGSPRPGAIGSSVIAGHVDSYRGPGIFFRLRLLRPGDRVYVRRADATLAVFRVTQVRQYRKSHFPATAVYGPAPQPELHLITCGGVFDRAAGSYLSNVVVYALALAPRAAARQRPAHS